MGNYNDAIFAGSALDREELFERSMRVLEEHGARFLQMARGMEWDPPRGAFSYVLDQDLEDLDSPREALLVSSGWQRVCMDFTITPLGLDFELHLFHGQPPHQGLETLCLSYPEHYTNLARRELDRAVGLLSLLEELGRALGRPAMVCGSRLASKTYRTDELERAFMEHVIATVDKDTNTMHTALFASAFYDRIGLPSDRAPFARREVEPGYDLATLLMP